LILVDDSALTGESMPVEKDTDILPEEAVLADRINMSFKGTYVSEGNADILVAASGLQAELGKIATMAHSSEQ
jgi:Ca2+-transporting ATPase